MFSLKRSSVTGLFILKLFPKKLLREGSELVLKGRIQEKKGHEGRRNSVLNSSTYVCFKGRDTVMIPCPS
jgi:hypothetical protein